MLLQAEKRILEEISKNSRAAQMEIHALLGKVYSDELALDLNRQSAKYARLQEKAEGTLKKEGEKPKPQGLWNDPDAGQPFRQIRCGTSVRNMCRNSAPG